MKEAVAVNILVGLEVGGDGIGGGVRRPGNIVESGRFVVYISVKKENELSRYKMKSPPHGRQSVNHVRISVWICWLYVGL